MDLGEAFEIRKVAPGIATLRCRTSRETFHPAIGPMAEAQVLHVEAQRLVERATLTPDSFVVWDIGLGAAGNAVAAINALRTPNLRNRGIEVHSFDRTFAPLRFALEHIDELDYLRPFTAAIDELLANGKTMIENIAWILHPGDFCNLIQTGPAPAPHALLFDPYSPRTNPEIWSLAQFTHLRARMTAQVPALLSTYSRSTAVRVTLLLAGFFVGRGTAIGAKDETTLAANRLDLLDAPLGIDWLKRVAESTASAPLRGKQNSSGRISSADFDQLRAHPQFAQSAEVGRPPQTSQIDPD